MPAWEESRRPERAEPGLARKLDRGVAGSAIQMDRSRPGWVRDPITLKAIGDASQARPLTAAMADLWRREVRNRELGG